MRGKLRWGPGLSTAILVAGAQVGNIQASPAFGFTGTTSLWVASRRHRPHGDHQGGGGGGGGGVKDRTVDLYVQSNVWAGPAAAPAGTPIPATASSSSRPVTSSGVRGRRSVVHAFVCTPQAWGSSIPVETTSICCGTRTPSRRGRLRSSSFRRARRERYRMLKETRTCSF